jgi:CRP/FNR family transcriptional regulator
MSTPRFDSAAVLKGTALFSELLPEELRTLAARTVRKLYKSGELLFSEGEACSGLQIIATGKVRIFKTSVSGREQVLAVNQPGESVAELPVFDGGFYPASAVAIEETQIAFIAHYVEGVIMWSFFANTA